MSPWLIPQPMIAVYVTVFIFALFVKQDFFLYLRRAPFSKWVSRETSKKATNFSKQTIGGD